MTCWGICKTCPADGGLNRLFRPSIIGVLAVRILARARRIGGMPLALVPVTLTFDLQGGKMMKCFLSPLMGAMLCAFASTQAWSMMSDEPPVDGRKEALVRLMPAKKEGRLRDHLPKVADEEVQAILDDPRLILYTENEMPKAYQFWDGQMPGVHNANYTSRPTAANRSATETASFPGMHRPALTARKTSPASVFCVCRKMRTARSIRSCGFVRARRKMGGGAIAGSSPPGRFSAKC